MARRTHRLNWRLLLLILVLAAGTAGVVARLVQVQIIDHDYYVAQAKLEHQFQKVVRAPRGAILDRNGHPLATTVAVFDVYIDPTSWQHDATAVAAAEALAPLLGREPAELIAAARAQERGDYLAARSVSTDVGLQIMKLTPLGVNTVDSSQRSYPEGDLASSLLGFIGQDLVGLTGIEADYDRELGGTPGMLYFEQDALGNPIPFGRQLVEEPERGGDIRLTIDRYIQRLVEEKLDAQIEETKAAGGSIIVMDPLTGEILAMASRPSFRLSQLNLDDEEQVSLYRNRTITDVYPPGSVMKTITMAAAIDLGLVSSQSTYFDSGSVVVYGHTISNWNFRSFGTSTATDVIQFSINTGAIWLSELLGPERFYEYVERFGLHEPTHVGLSGEVAGLVRMPEDEGWYAIDLATNSFGQGMAVTPLQTITAVSALVNGGRLMRPYVVKDVENPEGRRTFEPVVVRQVVKEDTARTLVQMMHAAVDGRTGHLAHVPGYRVGGKTGTSTFQDRGDTIASFVGFVPLERPRFIMLVKIDAPQTSPLGAVVAAPVFGELAPQILTYLDVQPDDVEFVEEGR